MDFRIVKYILRQKDHIINTKDKVINEYKEMIEMLKRQIVFLTTQIIRQKENVIEVTSVNSDMNEVSVVNGNDKSKQTAYDPEQVCQTVCDSVEISNVKNSAVTKTNNNIKSISHQASKFQPTNDSELWSDVVKRKQKTRPTVVGTKVINEKNNVKLKGVTKVVSLHVYRLAPDTTIDELTEYLKPDIPILLCEKLNSRNPQCYSSFRIDISEEYQEIAFKPEKWPGGACVRRFFHLRQQINNG